MEAQLPVIFALLGAIALSLGITPQVRSDLAGFVAAAMFLVALILALVGQS